MMVRLEVPAGAPWARCADSGVTLKAERFRDTRRRAEVGHEVRHVVEAELARRGGAGFRRCCAWR